MVERVAVLLGTVQFRLKVKVNVPESATLADAEKAAQVTLADDSVRRWKWVDELGLVILSSSQLMISFRGSQQSVGTYIPRHAVGSHLGEGGLSTGSGSLPWA